MAERILDIIKRIIWPNAHMVAYTFATMVLSAIASLLFFGGNGLLMRFAMILSFYLLILSVANAPRIVMLIRFAILTSSALAELRKQIESTQLGKAFLERDEVREIVFALPGVIGGLAYAIFNISVAIAERSLWLASVGIYALLLNVGRVYLVHGMRRRMRDDSEHLETWERKRCQLAGVWLAVLDVAMASMVYQMVRKNQGFDFPDFVLYLYALYAVYAVTASIANIYLFRKSKSPVRFALKAMNLSRALMSLLVLQTTLVGHSTFLIEFVQQFMNAFTGMTIIITTFIMAGVLVWKGMPPRKLLPGELPGTSWYRRPAPVRSGNKIPHKRQDRPKKPKAPTKRKPQARQPQHRNRNR